MPANATGIHRINNGRALGPRCLALAALCFIFMLVDLRTDLGAGPRALLMRISYPLQSLAATPRQLLNWSDNATRTRGDLALENARLKRERLLADARLQQLNVIRAENERLRAMLDARPRLSEQAQVAQILNVDSDPFRHRIVINKGSDDEVFQQQAVVDGDGVVGQVLQTGPYSANVMLISDPGHSIQVEVVRNGLRTVAFGAGEYDQLEIRFLPNNADIEVGDLLVTTSLGGDYPGGYPVATVISVEPQPRQAFARVIASPTAALTRIREVLLLAPQPDTSNPTEPVADGS